MPGRNLDDSTAKYEKQTPPDSQAHASDHVLTRFFHAPRAQVWTAWTDPKQVAQWFGPHDFTVPVSEADLRVGGALRITMRSADGVDYPIKGEYLEITEPQRLVYTFDNSDHPIEWKQQLADLAKKRGITDVDMKSLLTVTFQEVDQDKTKVTLRTHFASPEERDAYVEMGMTDGWAQTFEKLEEHLKRV